MFKSLIELVTGDLDQKRDYCRMKKRVKALPGDYRFAFRRIEHYMYAVGASGGSMTMFNDLKIFNDLVDFFESAAAEGRNVPDVIGSDVGSFTDEFLRAYENGETLRDKINREIMEKFNRKEHE